MPSEAEEFSLMRNKTILSATEGRNLTKRPCVFFAIRPFDLILQICGKSPMSGRFQV